MKSLFTVLSLFGGGKGEPIAQKRSPRPTAAKKQTRQIAARRNGQRSAGGQRVKAIGKPSDQASPKKGKNIPVPEELREVLLKLPDNSLVVVDEHVRTPAVLSHLSMLKMVGGKVSCKAVPLQQFLEYAQKQLGAAAVESGIETFNFARKLFQEAMDRNTSDIHIYMYEDYADVLFRIHGQMTLIQQWRKDQTEALFNSLYTSMADQADTNYRPTANQSARISSKKFLPEGLHGIRIVSGVHSEGNYMVLRLLYEATGEINGSLVERMAYLGYSDRQCTKISFMRQRPTGMILIAGPTGSGKSTTLKHALEAIRSEHPDRSIFTVEDPPEYPMKGILQLPVTNAESAEQRQEAFADAIRTLLRSDPNEIMIGEIRDFESAVLAVQGAMTGHKVWSTVHANSAFNIINRMAQMLTRSGSSDPLDLLADPTVLIGMIAQQLLPVICEECKIPLLGNEEEVPEPLLNRLSTVMASKGGFGGIKIKGKGCLKCRGLGVASRTVVAEVVATDPKMLMILQKKGISEAMKYWRTEQEGETILDLAIQKIKDGIVDPRHAEEVVGNLTVDVVFEDGVLQRSEMDIIEGKQVQGAVNQ